AVADRRVLGEDRDPLLALEVVGVHDQRANLLVLAEGVALLQKGVNERRFAVVDVGDDRHVPDVLSEIGHWTWQYTDADEDLGRKSRCRSCRPGSRAGGLGRDG